MQISHLEREVPLVKFKSLKNRLKHSYSTVIQFFCKQVKYLRELIPFSKKTAYQKKFKLQMLTYLLTKHDTKALWFLLQKCLYLKYSERNNCYALYTRMCWWWMEVGDFNRLFGNNFPEKLSSEEWNSRWIVMSWKPLTCRSPVPAHWELRWIQVISI